MDREWLAAFQGAVLGAFGARVKMIGIQGSRARGEATEHSDIDVVVILDALSYADLKRYDQAISDLPEREKICGFCSGAGELRAWDRGDLFQFYHDTLPLYGSLDWLEPLISRAEAYRSMHLGACNLYHMCVHNALHEKDPVLLHALFKQAVFVLQAKHCLETGAYLRARAELLEQLKGTDLAVLRAAMAEKAGEETRPDFDARSALLMEWAGGLVRRGDAYETVDS